MLIRDGENCVEFARCPGNAPYEGKTGTLTLFVRVSSGFLRWEARGVRFARREFDAFVARLGGPAIWTGGAAVCSMAGEFGPQFSLTVEPSEDPTRLRVHGELLHEYAHLGVFFDGLLRYDFVVEDRVVQAAAAGLAFLR